MGKYGRGFRKGYRMGKETVEDATIEHDDIKQADSVMGVHDLSQNIFDAIGAKSENLRGAFGRPIDSSGKEAERAGYGGIGETKGAHNPAYVKRSH